MVFESFTSKKIEKKKIQISLSTKWNAIALSNALKHGKRNECCSIVYAFDTYTKIRFLSNYDTFECSNKCHKSQIIVTNIARHSMHTNALDLSFEQCALIINNHPSPITHHTLHFK